MPNDGPRASIWAMSLRESLRRPKSPVAQALLPIGGGVAFLAVLGGALWIVASMVSGGKADLKVGKGVFDTLRYERLAADIATDGPRLFPSVVDANGSYLYIQHLGTEPTKGWFAFNATRPGQPQGCTVVWKPVPKVFEDPCDGKTYPANGEGLQQFDAIPNLATKRLVVDLKNPLPAATATTTTTLAS
jgi:hypothetical protein